MKKKLVIIDGSSLLYRAFYALPLLTNEEGVYTNAVYGFLRMLLKLYGELDPAYVAVSFDKGAHTFRNDLYKEYKGTRKATPQELISQFSLMKDVLGTMGIAVYEKEGYEGDDILGTLSARYENVLPIAVVTGDRDALQLVSSNTTVYLTKKGISQMSEMDEKAVFDAYGITPRQVVDLKALMGDASDHIPGVAGVGEKTAVRLLQQFGTLDHIYQRIDEISGKSLSAKLKEGRESAYLSQNLARIRRDMPLEADLEEMNRPPRKEDMNEIFRRMGFQKLAVDFQKIEFFKEPGTADDYALPEEKFCPEAWSEDLSFEGKVAALVPELSGQSPFFTCDSAVICCENNIFLVQKSQIQKVFLQLRKAFAVVTENSKACWETGLNVEGIPFFDTTVAAYLLDPARMTYPLSYLAEKFNIPYHPENSTEDDPKGHIRSCRLLLSAYEPVKESMDRHGVYDLFQHVEQPLVEVLAAMERAGISTDRNLWHQVRGDMGKREEKLLHSIYEAAGEIFNVNSPKQMGHILFEKLHMPAGKKTKTGYSTAAGVLESLADDHQIIRDILEYRTLSKLISTYLDALDELIRPETGRIHTSFNQTVTATGRLSSSDPNLQNIPVRTAEGKKIRSLFVPGPGYKYFISADYSQIELRILAHMSEDQNLINAFIDKEDIHRRTAAEVLGIPLEEVTPEQRSHAKAVNFGIIYGISDFGLARNLGISRKSAEEYIQTYFKRYPRIHQFLEELIEKARKTGQARTLFGRYRELPEINSPNFNRRSFAERTAMNTPIQGTAADIMKMAMISVYAKMKEKQFKSRILLQVHDELVVETAENEKEEVAQVLKETMEHAASLRVPLVVDVNSGGNWADAK